MTHSHKVLGFLLVAMLGIYGCARGPAGGSAGDRAGLEAKVQRLEEDFRAAAAARDSFRQRLVATEEKLAQTQKALDQTTTTATQDRQDRDAARAQLKARTAERDNLQVQYDGFRKNIKELLGQAEAALHPQSAPPTVVVGTPANPTEVSNVRN
jgi:septal ring factor EnvC (AmiA/AmiB activator)